MAVEVWLTTSCDRPSVHRPAVNRAARDTPVSLCVAEGTAHPSRSLALLIRQSWAHLLTREAVVAGVSHRTLTQIRTRNHQQDMEMRMEIPRPRTRQMLDRRLYPLVPHPHDRAFCEAHTGPR